MLYLDRLSTFCVIATHLDTIKLKDVFSWIVISYHANKSANEKKKFVYLYLMPCYKQTNVSTNKNSVEIRIIFKNKKIPKIIFKIISNSFFEN